MGVDRVILQQVFEIKESHSEFYEWYQEFIAFRQELDVKNSNDETLKDQEVYVLNLNVPSLEDPTEGARERVAEFEKVFNQVRDDQKKSAAAGQDAISGPTEPTSKGAVASKGAK